jgi:ceramide glucosyltransferase
MAVWQWIGDIFAALAVIGIGYQLVSLFALSRFFSKAAAQSSDDQAVTLLKPLHGAEPRLAENLASFVEQSHRGLVQMVCGVGDAGDAAVPVVEELILHTKPSSFPRRRESISNSSALNESLGENIAHEMGPRLRGDDEGLTLSIGPLAPGANAKIGNLIAMLPHAKHDILILSDSDMAVPSDYLSHLLAALKKPNVGAVTCLYAGRADAGIWSRINATIISYSGAPKVTMSLFTGAAVPCMGSTIALRRETLAKIGGFERFADVLADDYAMGEAIRATGKSIAMPPMLLTHACPEASFGDLWRQQLRWAITVRGLKPALHIASGVVYAVPFSLLSMIILPFNGLVLLAAAASARFATKRCVDAIAHRKTAPFWVVPVADCIEFAVWATSLFARTVHWRGAKLKMTRDGRI